jgi:hypothetical protein
MCVCVCVFNVVVWSAAMSCVCNVVCVIGWCSAYMTSIIGFLRLKSTSFVCLFF